MCGIAGEFSFGAGPPQPQVVKAMVRSLTHRGPDEEGFFAQGPLAMGMRRLSIVGISNGAQPLFSPDQSVVLVFNGEIYNYPQLRRELESRGHVFRTDSDGEVILALYQERGEDFLAPLNGMFAVALYDTSHQRLLLARDRLGIKPLFLFQDQHRLLFGSEIKALQQHPDCPREVRAAGLVSYLQHSYAPLRETLWRGIDRLLPGEMLVLQPGQEPQKKFYWSLPPMPDTTHAPRSLEQASGELRERLDESVRLQLLSDVPVGAFLSGGIDSAAVAALMRPRVSRLTTFCLGFEGDMADLDERQRAAETARFLQTDHVDISLAPGEITAAFDEALRFFDEPFGGGLHTWFLSREAARTHKVVLTGIGADELLGGYHRNQRLQALGFLKFFPGGLRSLAAAAPRWAGALQGQKNDRFRRLDRLLSAAPQEHYAAWINLFTQQELTPLLQPGHQALLSAQDFCQKAVAAFEGEAPAEITRRIAWLELRTTLVEDFLAYTDRTTMAHSLEARVPFLDHTLVEWVNTWPDAVRFTARPKQALYAAVADLLPPALQTRKKQPFLLPLARWLRGPLKPWVQETLMGELHSRAFLNPGAVRRLVEGFWRGEDRAWQVWHLMGVERFLRQTGAPIF